MEGDFTSWGSKRKPSLGWVEDANGCHIWTGYRTKQGYGWWHGKGVYRVRYLEEIGPIPDGLDLDHFACDGGPKGCCNPLHCRPASRRENLLRSEAASSINAAKTHCVRGHPLSPDNLVPYARRAGWRLCRVCNRERKRGQRKRKRLRRKGLM